MTDSVTYSRPYAEAAYKIAVETNELDMWTDNLSTLSRTIISGDVKAIIASPKIDPNKTLGFLNSFLTKENPMFSKFISIMIENNIKYDPVLIMKGDDDVELLIVEITSFVDFTILGCQNYSETTVGKGTQVKPVFLTVKIFTVYPQSKFKP